MASELIKNVTETVKPYADRLGLKIAEIEYAKKHDGMNLTVFIYKDGGIIDINDCENLHKLIDKPLDELNPTNDMPYTLNVSSIGLDRPLKSDADFDRNIGKEIEIKFYAPFKGKKTIEGILSDYNENIINLKTEDGVIEINRQDTAKITLKINF